NSWTAEPPPPEDAGVDVTSVAVAGEDVFAVAGGNLIERGRSGGWTAVDPSLLPDDPAPANGDLPLVAGLPDGGLLAPGRAGGLPPAGGGGAAPPPPPAGGGGAGPRGGGAATARAG